MRASFEELEELGEFDQLMAELLDEQLSDPRRDRLFTILHRDAKAMRDYVQCLMLHAAAEAEFGSAKVFEDQLTREARAQAAEQSDASRDVSMPPEQPAQKLDAVHRPRKVRRPLPISLVAGCTVVAALLALMALFTIPDWRSSRPERANDAPNNPAIVARAGYGFEAQWSGGNASWQYGAPLAAGQEFSLESGMAEIHFRSGARVVLEGPAQFRLVNENAGFMRRGRMLAHVSELAKGFKMGTPRWEVIDLGTEFGLSVSNRGDTEVLVFDGNVEVVASQHAHQPAAGAAAEAPRPKSARITQGSRIRIPADAAEIPPADSAEAAAPAGEEQFANLRRWSADKQTFRRETWAKHGEALRQDPDLRIYYSFANSSSDDGAILNEAAAAKDLYAARLAIPPAPAASSSFAAGRWPGKAALRFASEAQGAKQCLVVSEYPATTNGQLSVFAWVNVERQEDKDWAAFACNWGFEETTGQFYLGVRDDGLLAAYVTDSDGQAVHAAETENPFPRNRWQFVGFTHDGSWLRLYRDGEEVASARCNGILAEPPVKLMGIGLKPRDAHAAWGHNSWQGRMDEFALFHRGLSVEEVKAMYEAGK